MNTVGYSVQVELAVFRVFAGIAIDGKHGEGRIGSQLRVVLRNVDLSQENVSTWRMICCRKSLQHDFGFANPFARKGIEKIEIFVAVTVVLKAAEGRGNDLRPTRE